jgi:hypothetical protein
MFGYTMNTTYMNLTILNIFFLLTLVTENLQNHFLLLFIIYFRFWQYITPRKRKERRLLTCWVPIFNYIEYLTINI